MMDTRKQIEAHYRAAFEPLVASLTRSSGSRYAAEDVVQNAYVNALRWWKPEEDGNDIRDFDFDRWFGVVLLNCRREFANTERMHGMNTSSGVSVDVDKLPMPATQELKARRTEVMDRIMLKAQTHRVILYLFFVEEFSSKEVSAQVPESDAAIRKIIQRFREELREEMGM